VLKIRHAAPILPALLLLTALCLVACPLVKHGQPAPAARPSRETGAAATAQPTADPAPALEFIRQALAKPATDGQAPLGPVWNTIARLAGTPQAAALAPLRETISQQAAAGGEAVPPQLVGAWLAVEPKPAQQFIRAKLKNGQYTYLQALACSPALLRQELARLDLTKLPLDCAQLTLELLRRAGVTKDDASLLKQLARHASPQISLRAIGYLKALGACTPQQEQTLLAGVASKDQTVYVAALEGVKCSGAEGYADKLVPLVATVEMGDEDAAAKKDPRVLYAAYALAYLPGQQAELMRSNLLGARDPQVRWQARLGELLHGQPKYWNDAVDLFGCANKDLCTALQPPEALDPALLPLYAKAAQAEDVQVRVQAAQQLARYTTSGERGQAAGLLAQLAVDNDPQVAAAAFDSAAQLKLAELIPAAQAALEQKELPWEARLAAAGMLLAFAPATTAEERP
jgi:hypothetical protein